MCCALRALSGPTPPAVGRPDKEPLVKPPPTQGLPRSGAASSPRLPGAPDDCRRDAQLGAGSRAGHRWAASACARRRPPYPRAPNINWSTAFFSCQTGLHCARQCCPQACSSRSMHRAPAGSAAPAAAGAAGAGASSRRAGRHAPRRLPLALPPPPPPSEHYDRATCPALVSPEFLFFSSPMRLCSLRPLHLFR